jgi:FkbM family methyltransferase
VTGLINKLKRALKQALQYFLARRGYSLSRSQPAAAIKQAWPTPGRATMEGVIERIARRNIKINTVIDIGASNGSWSELLLKRYPLAQYLLIEAQPVHEPALRQFCQAWPNTSYILAAAGETSGTIFFNASDPFSGQASYSPYPSHNIEVSVTTVDREVEKHGRSGPYLLKLDTHGFEVPILKGAADTLRDTAVIVVECYNYKIAHEALYFFEMCAHLKELGFRCIDFADPMWRLYDDTLWQMDLVFVRDNLPEFNYLGYE